jgi:hypothetical protein
MMLVQLQLDLELSVLVISCTVSYTDHTQPLVVAKPSKKEQEEEKS